MGGVAGGDGAITRGLAQLGVNPPRHARLLTGLTVALGAVAGALAAWRAGSWWLLPALLVWAYGLAVVGTCDAMTQRVPTPLARQATVATLLLVVAAAAATGTWHWAEFAAISGAVAAVIFTFFWRFLGVGFGDVRIALLGGVGIVEPTRTGLTAALAVLVVILLTQALMAMSRGGNRHTMIAFGPAIAAAAVVAAIA